MTALRIGPRAARAGRDDSGTTMVTIVVIASILFMLLTSGLVFTEFYSTQTQSFVARTQAMQLADAGLNEYLDQLSQNYTYCKSTPRLGPTAMTGGSWTVTATMETTVAPLTLTSTGIMADGTHATVVATVRFPTFSNYTVFVDDTGGTYSIGAGATFYGPVRCNGNISNSGVITGLAQAGGSCSAGQSFAANYPGGYQNAARIVNFSALGTDLTDMKATAIAQSSEYGASGALGYYANISGSQVGISKITAINRNYPRSGYPTDPQLGALTLTSVATLTIPASGVIFFDDDVWLQGTYSAALTIGTSRNAYITGNVLPSSTNTTHSCGVVASNNVLFPYWMQSMPTSQSVQAALLAETAGVGPDTTGAGSCKQYTTSSKTWSTSYTPPLKSAITISGSRAMETEIGFSSGYTTRSFLIDPRLKSNPPPMYPQVPGDALAVDTWVVN